MISDRALALAVERTVLTPGQAEQLRALETETAGRAPEPVDDEALRFVTGFADIFVTIGIVLFLGALAFLMNAGNGSILAFAGLAACAWVIAEFFTGKRRMALPSIVLLVVFVGAVFAMSVETFALVLPQTRGTLGRIWSEPAFELVPLALAAIVTTAAAALHYLRFRVPITIAAGTAALCVLVLTIVVGLVPHPGETEINIVLFLCGLAVFGLAMRFDMSDPARVTRRTDIAFWLHLLAAPLIVHALIRGFLHGLDGGMTREAALGILSIFLILGIVAVVIDRRAMLVSGLAYAGFAYGTLIKQLGVANADILVPTVLLTLGAFILLLSAGWLPLRRLLLQRLPGRLARRLPHPLVTSQA